MCFVEHFEKIVCYNKINKLEFMGKISCLCLDEILRSLQDDRL